MISAIDALERLRAGNQRYLSGVHSVATLAHDDRRRKLVVAQQPFAVILGCSDSRVPVEILFDQGLGDLFVIRVAGNIVTPALVGSVEFAVGKLGVRLVVVLGHSNCGALAATLDYLEDPSPVDSPNLRTIVESIRPAIEPLLETESRDHPNTLLAEAVRANVCASTEQLTQKSELLAHLLGADGLNVVGAEYSLETGVVDFIDCFPE